MAKHPLNVALGAELRSLRLSLGLTGAEAARQLGWEQYKLSRVETGSFGATLHQVAALLDFYGAAEEVRAELLSRAAHRDGIEGAWIVRAGGPARRQGSVGRIESRVSMIRCYACTVVPGLLQTPGLTEGLAATGGWDDVSGIVRKRGERQRDFEGRGAVPLDVVLDARVLMRWPGGNEVMIDQLVKLLDLPASTTVRVLPAGGRAGVVAVSGFFIYEFGPETPKVVFSEGQRADLYMSDPDDVASFEDLFESLKSASFALDESRSYLRGVLHDLRADTTRRE